MHQRAAEGRPHRSTLTTDEFMSATLDVWDIEPESARRVNHPAPFPVQLPERLIHLYTYEDDIVLDPFLGSGSTLVAALRCNRRGVGYDIDPEHVKLARRRLQDERDRRHGPPSPTPTRRHTRSSVTEIPAPCQVDDAENFQATATAEGKAAHAIAAGRLADAGFQIGQRNAKIRGTGVVMNLVALDANDEPWYFDVTGAFTTTRGGLLRTDTVWRCLGRAHVIRNKVNNAAPPGEKIPLVFFTSHLPKKGNEGDLALRAAGPTAFFDAIEMYSEVGLGRLRVYAAGGHRTRPLLGYWSEKDIARLA